jgi:cephalosporin-C deacetylase-like acetyl esterase
MPSRLFALTALLVLSVPLPAADAPAETSRGDRMRDAYFRREVERIADASLADVKTLADWKKKRPELHRQFLDMMGLWPLPPRSDLHATITGKLDADNFTVEKLHFQSMPGLYVTGNLYVPKNRKGPLPAVLYVCGHGNVVVEKVSYGSKVSYQHHPAWFASNGYVCLILDTLQLGEIEGLHHGTSRFDMWWWQCLGYTPAGIECWNAMRALDYLQSRPEVDPKKLGVTGRSGGGATSWWVAAADERVQCIVPVAGIADLRAHVVEGIAPRRKTGVISGHCDCMYFVNTYRWDFDVVLALCAPRPLLLGNSDVDDIFPVPGYRRLADKAKRIYELYGAADHFQLMETMGPHKDTPELRAGAFQWMNRWLKGTTGEIDDPERPRFTPQQLRVFDRLPEDEINTTIHETFRKAAHFNMPRNPDVAREWWRGKAPELMAALREQSFRGHPLKVGRVGFWPGESPESDGLRLWAIDFGTEQGVDLRLWILMAAKVEKPSVLVVNVLDEEGWREWCRDLGPDFAASLRLTNPPDRDAKKFEQNRRALETNKWAFVAVCPRGVGPTRWNEQDPFDPKKPAGHQIRRRFALLGQTLDSARVWDVRCALECLRSIPDLKGVPVWLHGKKEMAGIALYAGLFEPDVARFDLWYPPASHRQGPIFLNVLRVLDMPQAVALALPRQVRIYVKDDAEAKAWDWPMELRQPELQIRKVGE